jgi:hypothetical protein
LSPGFFVLFSVGDNVWNIMLQIFAFTIPCDNSPLSQQFTTGAKGISQQLIAITKRCGVTRDQS